MTDEELLREFRYLRNYLSEFRREVMQRFGDIDRPMDTLASTISGIDTRLPALTRAIMTMESRIYKQNDVDILRDTKIRELEARIQRLEGVA